MKTKPLGRKRGHRIHLVKNLGRSLVIAEKIITTLPKARMIRPVIERWITLAKKGSANKLSQLTYLRLLVARIGDKQAADKLINDIAKRTKDRNGGYVRILKLGTRLGDNSMNAMVELVDKPEKEEKKVKSKKDSDQESVKKSKNKKLTAKS